MLMVFPGVCDPQDAVNGSYYVAADEVDGDSTRPQAEDFNLVKNKRLKERDTGKHSDVIVIN